MILLSATMPVEVLEVTKRFMREPIKILVKKDELTLEGIRQFYINVEKEVEVLFLIRSELTYCFITHCLLIILLVGMEIGYFM